MDWSASDWTRFGQETVKLPLIWVPDSYEGPLPGYPWFEAGRLMLGGGWPLNAAPDTLRRDGRVSAVLESQEPGADDPRGVGIAL